MKRHFDHSKSLLKLTLCLTFSIFTLTTPAFAQKTEIKEGVKYIHNEGKGLWADDENVRIEYLGVLGELESEDENYMFYLPKSITGDKVGNIYVLDAGNHRIQKFDKNRKYVASLGRRGQGPEEFILPTFFAIDTEENLNVYDSSNKRITRFTSDGEYIDSKRKKETTFSFNFLKSGEMIVRNSGLEGYRSSKGSVPMFFVLNDKLEKLRNIGQSIYYGEELHKKYGGLNRIKYCLDDDDNIYVSYIGQNRIEKYSSDGKLLYVMDRPLSEYIAKRKRTAPLSPAYSAGIDIDSSGRFWVVTSRKKVDRKYSAGTGLRTENNIKSYVVWGNTEIKETDSQRLEVFSKDGVLLKTFVLNSFVDELKIIDDKIYLLDRLRGMQFHVYDIQIEK